MPVAPSRGIPELAGLGSYADAARIGYSVDENVRRLARYQWVERRLMATLIAHLPSTPVWEVKCGAALHQWEAAEHVDAIRQRIGEMRHPVPELDQPPDLALDAFLEEMYRAEDVVELVVGVYDVARRALGYAYRTHLTESNLLVDQPTRRILRFALLDHDEALRWGDAALRGLLGSDPAAAVRADAWRTHLCAYLVAAGGIAGPKPGQPTPPLPPARAAGGPFLPSMHPARDARFHGRYNFNFPPHVVYNARTAPADERNLALLCKRTLEMDVPEMMASVMVQRAEQPWEFHRDYSRQLWDEARHAMLGTVALEARGIDWTRIPLNVGFALRLNLHAEPLERQIMLYAIEQSLMPAETGKRFEHETAVAAGDQLSAHFHDYDWADEVLHAHIGRRLLKREGISQEDALDRAHQVQERTWAALEQYRAREEQAEWWDGFVRVALGRPSALRPDERGELKILAE